MLSPSQRHRAEDVARKLRRERSEPLLPRRYRPLVPALLDDAPSLHLDDQSALASPSGDASSSYVHDRARTRAVGGDYIVTSAAVDPAYEPYCEDRLGLGRVQWLVVEGEGDPRHLASRSMRDRSVRGELVRAFRQKSFSTSTPIWASPTSGSSPSPFAARAEGRSKWWRLRPR